MKKKMVTLAIAVAMMISLVSCGSGNETPTDVLVAGEAGATAKNKGGVVIEVNTSYGTQTTAKTTTATSKQQATTVKATTKAATAKTTVKTTAKKTTAKPQPKTTAKATTKATTKQSGVTKEDILWAQQKANEYIKTLPKAKLNPDAGGYSCENGAPWGVDWYTSKEQVYSDFKELIDSEYQDCVEYGWNGIDMYLKVAFYDYGWEYWCMYMIQL